MKGGEWNKTQTYFEQCPYYIYPTYTRHVVNLVLSCNNYMYIVERVRYTCRLSPQPSFKIARGGWGTAVPNNIVFLIITNSICTIILN